MSQVYQFSIMCHYAKLIDPSDNRGKEHLLIDIIDILVIMLCAVISDAEGWEDIAEYGRARQEWLSGFLSLRLDSALLLNAKKRLGIIAI